MMANALTDGVMRVGFTGMAHRFSRPQSGPNFKVRFDTTEEVWEVFKESDTRGMKLQAVLGEGGNEPFYTFGFYNPSPNFSKSNGVPIYRITFEVTREDWLWLLDNIDPDAVLAGEISLEGELEPQHPYPEVPSYLHQSGFFRAPPVWEVIGPDSDYRVWCQNRPCCICGAFDYDPNTGLTQTEYAHVRRSHDASSGVAHKPEYAGLPMCHEHHRMQHDHGESALGRDLEKLAIRYLEAWAHQKLSERLGVLSLKDLSHQEMADWAWQAGVYAFLPSEIKKNAAKEKAVE